MFFSDLVISLTADLSSRQGHVVHVVSVWEWRVSVCNWDISWSAGSNAGVRLLSAS